MFFLDEDYKNFSYCFAYIGTQPLGKVSFSGLLPGLVTFQQ